MQSSSHHGILSRNGAPTLNGVQEVGLSLHTPAKNLSLPANISNGCATRHPSATPQNIGFLFQTYLNRIIELIPYFRPQIHMLGLFQLPHIPIKPESHTWQLPFAFPDKILSLQYSNTSNTAVLLCMWPQCPIWPFKG
jgi:hypothetical protein